MVRRRFFENIFQYSSAPLFVRCEYSTPIRKWQMASNTASGWHTTRRLWMDPCRPVQLIHWPDEFAFDQFEEQARRGTMGMLGGRGSKIGSVRARLKVAIRCFSASAHRYVQYRLLLNARSLEIRMFFDVFHLKEFLFRRSQSHAQNGKPLTRNAIKLHVACRKKSNVSDSM